MQCLYFDQVATAGTVRAVAYDGGETNLLELSSQQKRKVRNTVLGMVYQMKVHKVAMERLKQKQI